MGLEVKMKEKQRRREEEIKKERKCLEELKCDLKKVKDEIKKGQHYEFKDRDEQESYS